MKYFSIGLIMILLPTLACANELSVFAASSLTEALHQVAQKYQTRHPDVQIRLLFAGSQTLATQIEQGAPADIFIAANRSVMKRLKKTGLVENPRLLLHNRLVLAVQPDLTPPPVSLADLERPGVLLVVGNRQVPIGNYTRQLFTRLAADPAYGPELVHKIEKNVVSEENRVKAIVAKLLLGEVDAGILYQTDLTAQNTRKLTAIALPPKYNPLVGYPVAKVTTGQSQADDFIAFLFGKEAQLIFSQRGFMPGEGP